MTDRNGDPDDIGRPGPAQRPWVHPSELPSDPASKPRPRLVLPVTAGLAGVLAAVGLGALALDVTGSGTALGPASTTTPRLAVTPTALGNGDGAVPTVRGSLDGAVVAVTAWSGARARYGSGVTYEDDGLVITAASVVEDADAVEIGAPGTGRRGAEVVGRDPANDLALLRVDPTEAQLHAMTSPGRDPGVHVGQSCYLVGATDEGSSLQMRRGSIRGTGGMVHHGDRWMVDVIAVDVGAGARGVGGALLDASGGLLGIVTAASVDDGAVVVPVRTAWRSAEQIMRHGDVEHPWLGVGTVDAEGVRLGALVTNVAPGSPAAVVGLTAGDVIVAIDDDPVEGVAGLMRAVRAHEVGERVTVTLVRDGDTLELTVRLGRR